MRGKKGLTGGKRVEREVEKKRQIWTCFCVDDGQRAARAFAAHLRIQEVLLAIDEFVAALRFAET